MSVLRLIMRLYLWLFTTVRGEPRRAEAKQSDGDRGSHEENQGKMKALCHTHTLSSSDLCFLFHDGGQKLPFYNKTVITHTHTHNTKTYKTHKECVAVGWNLYQGWSDAFSGWTTEHEFWESNKGEVGVFERVEGHSVCKCVCVCVITAFN